MVEPSDERTRDDGSITQHYAGRVSPDTPQPPTIFAQLQAPVWRVASGALRRSVAFRVRDALRLPNTRPVHRRVPQRNEPGETKNFSGELIFFFWGG